MAAWGDVGAAVLLALLAVLATVRWLKDRHPIDGETALALGLLGMIGVITALSSAFHANPAVSSSLVGAFLLAQPYVLLRLSRHFGTVPSWQSWAAAVGLVSSLAWLAADRGHATHAAGILIAVYFVAVEGFAGWRFLREARRVQGVVRQRLTAVALGSACLALAIAVDALREIAPAGVTGLGLITTALALLTGINYAVGFMPPSWLRRRWQLPVLYALIDRLRTIEDPTLIEGALCEASLAATGAQAVGLAKPGSDPGRLQLAWHTGPLSASEAPLLIDLAEPGVIASSWRANAPSSPGAPTPSAQEQAQLDRLLARSLWATLVTAPDFPPLAVLAVASSRYSLFATDDRDLLELMASHAAMVLANARLLAETTRQNAHLQAVAEVAAASLIPLDDQEMLNQVTDAVLRGTGASRAAIWLMEGTDLVRRVSRPDALAELRWARGTGLIGRSLEQNETIYSPDVLSDPRFVLGEEASALGYRSVLSVPLVVLGEPVGVIGLYWAASDGLDRGEITNIEVIAQEVALAVRNLQLFKSAERRNERLRALYASSLALGVELELPALLKHLADAARDLTGARYSAIGLSDGGQMMAHFVTSGLSPEEVAAIGAPPSGKGLLGALARVDGALRVDDIASDARATGMPANHPQMTTFLGVPIRHEQLYFGTLYVTDKASGRPFDDEDAQSLTALAAQAALAIRNTQLLADTLRTAGELRAVNSELVQASAAKSVFLASMSHELRTPLNAVLGFTEIMQDDPDLPPETRLHYLETVHQSGSHLLGLINDILDLSKVEAGRMELQLETFELSDLVDEVLNTVRPLAERAEVALTRRETASVRLECDRGKCKQILYNLLSNAIKFTPPGGRATVSWGLEAERLLLEVTDTGVGIPKDEQERVFEEFHQAASGAGRGGTGLGLTLARRFAELHGGRLWLESEVGHGSTFHLELPAIEQMRVPLDELPEVVVADSALSPGGAPLVLVVEDDQPAAGLLTSMLHRQGYRVVSVRSGEEAIAQAVRLSPAAITLDVILPGMSGWDTLRALRQSAATAQIPVVVVTIVDEPETAIALGAADFLLKPVSRQALANSLNRLGMVGSSGAGARLALVIDDDPDARTMIGAAVRSFGLEVAESASGPDGLESARRRAPDVVLLDLVMPGMNGFKVLEEMRSDPDLASVPVLIVTAKDLTSKESEQLTACAAQILHKGRYGRQELGSWLSRTLESR